MEKYHGLQLNHLVAIFLASMFGSLSLTVLMTQAIEPGMPLPLLPRVLLTAAAIIVYAAIVWVTFYVVVPSWRPALCNLLRQRS